MSSENNRKRSFLEKHTPKTPEEIEERMKESAQVRQKHSGDMQNIGDNLMNYFKLLDPLVDPETENVIAMIRRPSYNELQSLVPGELRQYSENPRDIPPDIAQKYENSQFKLMATLIGKPKESAEWWKDNATQQFIILFQNHLVKMFRDMGVDIENF